MTFAFTILLGILTLIQSTLGGLLHGVAYSAVSSPSVNYNYGRIAGYASPSIITNPSVAASTYSSSRYTAYTLVPLTASVAAPDVRQPVGGFVRAYVAPSLPRRSGFSNSLFKQGISAYAAVPIAGYRARFAGPSLRNFATSSTSLRNFATADTVSVEGLYPPPAGWDDYADPTILNDQRNYGALDTENPISIW